MSPPKSKQRRGNPRHRRRTKVALPHSGNEVPVPKVSAVEKEGPPKNTTSSGKRTRIENLPRNVTYEQRKKIMTYFEEYNPQTVLIKRGVKYDSNKCRVFISFTTTDDMKKAVDQMNAAMILNGKISVIPDTTTEPVRGEFYEVCSPAFSPTVGSDPPSGHARPNILSKPEAREADRRRKLLSSPRAAIKEQEVTAAYARYALQPADYAEMTAAEKLEWFADEVDHGRRILERGSHNFPHQRLATLAADVDDHFPYEFFARIREWGANETTSLPFTE
ncbi:MAG: hypothetical protein M1818_006838 [Claussenomyces sp. TS43310]|nr:MAG: hypothetical protein M1818_006838 [Claussenomyces sp. TS43310]